MPQKIFLLALIVSLASCSPLSNNIIATSTFVPATQTPTATLTAIPLPSITPTETPDLRFGVPPIVDTGFTLNKDMTLLMYTETDTNGNTKYWSDVKFWNDSELVTGHWYQKRGDFFLIDQAENNYGLPNMIPLRIFFLDDLQLLKSQVYLKHPDGTGTYNTWDDKAKSFDGFLLGQLWDRLNQGTPSLPDYTNYFDKMKNGGISFPMTIPNLTGAEWSPSTTVGGNVFFAPWDDTDPTKDQRFFVWSYYEQDNINFRSTTYMGADGSVSIIMSCDRPLNSLTSEQMIKAVLFGIARAILNADQSPSYYKNTQLIGHQIQSFVDEASRGPGPRPTDNPYIKVDTSP